MRIKAIVKKPDELYGHICSIEKTLDNLQKIVDGYIENYYLTDNVVIICNEEGGIKNLPHNMKVPGAEFVGTIIVVGFEDCDYIDLPISFNEWQYVVNMFEIGTIQPPKNHPDMVWHILNEDDPKTYPQNDDYILLSFDNYKLICIGRCEGNEDEGYTFYEGDDDIPLIESELFVNAWMPLPERWCGYDL